MLNVSQSLREPLDRHGVAEILGADIGAPRMPLARYGSPTDTRLGGYRGRSGAAQAVRPTERPPPNTARHTCVKLRGPAFGASIAAPRKSIHGADLTVGVHRHAQRFQNHKPQCIASLGTNTSELAYARASDSPYRGPVSVNFGWSRCNDDQRDRSDGPRGMTWKCYVRKNENSC
jgi:hypothetical protein